MPGRFVPTANGTVLDMTPPAVREEPACPEAREALPSPGASDVPLEGSPPPEAIAVEPPEAMAVEPPEAMAAEPREAMAVEPREAMAVEPPEAMAEPSAEPPLSPGRAANALRNVAPSLSKKARRRAAFKVRKQQKVLRRG